MLCRLLRSELSSSIQLLDVICDRRHHVRWHVLRHLRRDSRPADCDKAMLARAVSVAPTGLPRRRCRRKNIMARKIRKANTRKARNHSIPIGRQEGRRRQCR